jgi:O-antigen/teichoic acid export membrane protein
MHTPREHIERAVWTLVDQGTVSLGNFLVNVQLARHLPVSEYGAFALLLSLYYLAQHINGSLLLYPLMLRIAGSKEEQPASLFSITILLVAITSLALSILLAAALFALGRHDIAIAAAAYVILGQLQDATRRSLLATFRHRTANIGDAVTYIGQACAVAVLVSAGAVSLPAALYTMAAASGLAAIIQARQLRLSVPKFHIPLKMLQEFWLNGRWAIINKLLILLNVQIFPWTLAILEGPATVAGFQAVLNIANATNPIVFGLSNIVSPAVAQIHANSGIRAAWKTARIYILMGAPLIFGYCLAVMLVPDFVLKLFYGANSSYLGLEAAVRIILLAVAISYVADLIEAFLFGVEAGRAALLISAIGLATAAVLLPFTESRGVLGGTVILAIASAVRLAASFYLMSRVTAESGRLPYSARYASRLGETQ